MKIVKTTFGFNLKVKVEENVFFNFEFREEDDRVFQDLTSCNGWLLSAIINGEPILGKEYWE